LEQLVKERTAGIEAANQTLRASRRAALSLTEDALEARRLAEQEVLKRRQAMDALRELNTELEQRVADQTAEIREANETSNCASRSAPPNSKPPTIPSAARVCPR